MDTFGLVVFKVTWRSFVHMSEMASNGAEFGNKARQD